MIQYKRLIEKTSYFQDCTGQIYETHTPYHEQALILNQTQPIYTLKQEHNVRQFLENFKTIPKTEQEILNQKITN